MIVRKQQASILSWPLVMTRRINRLRQYVLVAFNFGQESREKSLKIVDSQVTPLQTNLGSAYSLLIFKRLSFVGKHLHFELVLFLDYIGLATGKVMSSLQAG